MCTSTSPSRATFPKANSVCLFQVSEDFTTTRGETGVRTVTVTAGDLYDRLNLFQIGAVNTSGAGNEFANYFRDGNSGFVRVSDQNNWDNTSYDDGTGVLATLTNNRYAVLWFYLETDGEIVCVYGRAQYTTAAQAGDEAVPATVPVRLEAHGVLIGRIVFQEGVNIAESVESVYTATFTGTGVTDHGNLAGLSDDDHSQYLFTDGTRQLTGEWNAGSFKISTNEIISGSGLTSTLGISGATVNATGSISGSRIGITDQYTFPTADGTARQLIETDGTGVLSFTNKISGSSLVATDLVSGQIVFPDENRVLSGSSNLFWNGSRLGVGTITPGFPLDIVGATDQLQIRVADNETDATVKIGGFTGRHYLNAEEDVSLLVCAQSNGANTFFWGGGSASFNAATGHNFYTAANSTTTTGTLRFSINSAGDADFQGNVFLSNDNKVLKFGAAKDAGLSYDGTDLVIESSLVGSGTVKFNSANNWTANATNTVTISNVAPAGVGTATISKWFTVKDDAGTVFYIPAWT